MIQQKKGKSLTENDFFNKYYSFHTTKGIKIIKIIVIVKFSLNTVKQHKSP